MRRPLLVVVVVVVETGARHGGGETLTLASGTVDDDDLPQARDFSRTVRRERGACIKSVLCLIITPRKSRLKSNFGKRPLN